MPASPVESRPVHRRTEGHGSVPAPSEPSGRPKGCWCNASVGHSVAARHEGYALPVPYTFQVTIDSARPHVLADWWAAALGWQVEPSNEEFIRQMIAEGHATDDDTMRHDGALVWKDGAAVRHPDGLERAPRLLFQLVPESKTAKNRVHLDLHIGDDDLGEVVERLRAAGATFLHEGRQGPHTWVTMADPEGNEFCLSG